MIIEPVHAALMEKVRAMTDEQIQTVIKSLLESWGHRGVTVTRVWWGKKYLKCNYTTHENFLANLFPAKAQGLTRKRPVTHDIDLYFVAKEHKRLFGAS